jgi:Flp pilus assembly pilin Flp
MGRQLGCFLSEEAGQDLVEYALLLLMILLISVAAMKAVGERISSAFSGFVSLMS